MGYVHPHRPDIYVSYAHVDDEPLNSDGGGWVSELVRLLQRRLDQKIGRRGEVQIWRNTALSFTERMSPQIEEKLQDAAVVLVFLSPAYLASAWCQHELEALAQDPRQRFARSRLFVVEIDRVERPAQLTEWLGYRFWLQDPQSGADGH